MLASWILGGNHAAAFLELERVTRESLLFSNVEWYQTCRPSSRKSLTRLNTALMMKTRLILTLITGLAETLWSADFQLRQPVKHPGAPDGSAGVASGTSHFIDACDEDNFLRLYPSDTDAGPKVLLDLNQLLGFSKENGKFKECDLEGAARIGDRIYW